VTQHVQDPITVSVSEAVRLTGLSRSKLYVEMAAGRLNFLKVGDRRLIRVSALHEFLQLMEKRNAE
jgi:excisionase family DNA binding protein